MIFVSSFLNRYFNLRFKNKSFRFKIYDKALKKELRNSRLGRIILRNLNLAMSANPSMHLEIIKMNNSFDYQKSFWDSDFGFMWYAGNFKNNIYNQFALQVFNENNYSSLLDLGCGWGELCSMVINSKNSKLVYGIDIAEGVIRIAKETHKSLNINFEQKSILEIDQKFDFITSIGSLDYISPEDILPTLVKAINLCKSEILIIHSLRQTPLDLFLNIENSIEIRRYDIGFVHPVKYLLEKLRPQYLITYTIETIGDDSSLIRIKKSKI